VARSLLKMMPLVYSCAEIKLEMLTVAKSLCSGANETVTEELAEILWVGIHSLCSPLLFSQSQSQSQSQFFFFFFFF